MDDVQRCDIQSYKYLIDSLLSIPMEAPKSDRFLMVNVCEKGLQFTGKCTSLMK